MRRYPRRFVTYALSLLLFLSSLLFCLGTEQWPLMARPWSSNIAVTTEVITAAQQVQQGVNHYQSGDFKRAIQDWQPALTHYQNSGDHPNTAIVLENLARAYRNIGQTDTAINHWQQSIDLYRHQLKNLQKVGHLLTEQAQTYIQLGQPRVAIALLCNSLQPDAECNPESALGIAYTQGDPIGEAAALGSLGNAYRQRGAYDVAIHWLEKGLIITKTLDNPAYQALMLNSLGNAHTSQALLRYRRAESFREIGYTRQANLLEAEGQTNDQAALQAFQASLALSPNDAPTQLRALLNAIPVYYRTEAEAQGVEAHHQARQILETLPESQDKVFAALNLANLQQPESQTNLLFSRTYCARADYDPQIRSLLNMAITTAQHLGDRRAESFALGELGHLYECRGDYDQALALTQKARWAAEALNAMDSLYLWEWQTGRILKAQRQEPDAIAAYEQALSTLTSIRADIVVANRDLQFDFRDTVEPAYRGLARLHLDRSQNVSLSPSPDSNQVNLEKVLNTVDSLKLAELQNYFGNECAISALPEETTVERVSQGAATAVISTIIFNDRTAVTLTLPDQQRQVAWIEAPKMQVRQAVNDYRLGLESYYQTYDPKPAQKLYNWLIRPFESALQAQGVKTLVFVQDGIFRSVPMAALHDGQNFLIEVYAIATTPSLKLTAPHSINRQALNVLALGLTEAATIDQKQFPALEYVNQEVTGIQSQLPGTQLLLNTQFTRDRLQQALNTKAYSIVHIATHAEFGPEPGDTFFVTGNNQTLAINDFDTLLRSATSTRGESIELLMLTACKTAVGDDRAALGLAGVALQAGAKSAVASLWSINDQATAQFVAHFYTELLKAGTTKAQALQIAQQSLLEAGGDTARPAYWAPFVLIGNWL